MQNFKEGTLMIEIEKGGKNILKWTGKSEDRDPASLLNPYFDSLVEELKGKELEVQFEELEYMNSSTVTPIIQLIKKLNTSNIKTIFTYNKNSKWQCASFKALETIVSNMNNIDVVGK